MMFDSSFVVARREMKDAVSDWRIVTPMLVLAIVFPVLVVMGILVGIPMMDRIDPNAAAVKLVPFGAMLVGFFPISISLVVALESFVGEKERNTLEALLAMPLSDAELFLGKLMAVLIPPVFLSMVALSIYTVGLRFILNFHLAPDFLLITVLLSLVEALVMVAGAVVVSSHTTSVRAANLLASFIIMPMVIVLQGELLLVITGYGQALWFILAELLVIAVILIRMGVTVFNREEILARENDQISPKSIARYFWRSIRALPNSQPDHDLAQAKPLSLWRLYSVDMPLILRANWLPLLLASVLIAVGIFIGYAMALQSPLPASLRNLAEMARYDKAIEDLDHLSTWAIFIHNVRALSISAILSLFSFGAASLLLLLLPVGLAGFFSGQAANLGLDPGAFALAFFVPHGIVEVPVAIVSSVLSLRLGMSLMCPPKGLTFGESLLLALANWSKTMIALLPFLLLAAYIEANITPIVAMWIFGGP